MRHNTFSGTAGGQFYIGDQVDPHAPVRDDPPTHSGSVTSMTVMGAVTHLHVAGADFSAVTPGQAIHLALTLNGGGPQHHWTEVLGVVGAPPDTLVVRTLPEYAANPPATFDVYAAFTGGVRNLCGHWGATATHAGGVTTLYAERFLPTNLVGMYVQLDLCAPQSFMITGVSGRTMTITGNFTSVVQVGDPFVILPTVGVDPATAAPYTGTLGTDSRYGWAGYFRLDPVGGSVNLAGGWHAWNRNFLVGPDGLFGRWGTPDALARPWANLQEYVGGGPVARGDWSGLVWRRFSNPNGGTYVRWFPPPQKPVYGWQWVYFGMSNFWGIYDWVFEGAPDTVIPTPPTVPTLPQSQPQQGGAGKAPTSNPTSTSGSPGGTASGQPGGPGAPGTSTTPSQPGSGTAPAPTGPAGPTGPDEPEPYPEPGDVDCWEELAARIQRRRSRTPCDFWALRYAWAMSANAGCWKSSNQPLCYAITAVHARKMRDELQKRNCPVPKCP